MGKKYLDTKEGSLEQSVLGVWQTAIEEGETRVDGRTKSYKEHRAKLEAARAKREAAKQAKFSEKVKESTTDFNVESLLAEDNVDVLKSIVKSKSAKPMKFKDGTMKVDLFTASAMVQVLDKVNPANKKKLTNMINGKKGQFTAAANAIMKMVGK